MNHLPFKSVCFSISSSWVLAISLALSTHHSRGDIKSISFFHRLCSLHHQLGLGDTHTVFLIVVIVGIKGCLPYTGLDWESLSYYIAVFFAYLYSYVVSIVLLCHLESSTRASERVEYSVSFVAPREDMVFC